MSRHPFDVSIDFPLYQSKHGLYFIGETPILSGLSQHALAWLHNPSDSGRRLYVNAITITNISDSDLLAEFILRAKFIDGQTSDLVSCTNTDIYPVSFPAGVIKYYEPPVPVPDTGIAIFSRILPQRSTLVVDGGQIILGQRQSLGVYIDGFPPVAFDSIRFAFGWSEEIIDCCK